MTRNRLAKLCSRVLIPIMFAAMPNEDATHLVELLDKFDAFHAT